MRSDRRLLRWFNLIRRKFFYGEIAIPKSVCVRWATVDDEDEKNLGSASLCLDGTHKYQILLDPDHNTCLSHILVTLVHEMIHVATELKDCHDEPFEKVFRVLDQRGIFKLGAIRRNSTLL